MCAECSASRGASVPGTRHSFTDLPDTTGTLVDVTGFAAEFELDEAARAVTVPAGIRYGVLAVWLDDRGWALRNMGSLPHINVGGATATGTHGSGDANPVLSASVRALRYVGADAEVHEVRRGTPTSTRWSSVSAPTASSCH